MKLTKKQKEVAIAACDGWVDGHDGCSYDCKNETRNTQLCEDPHKTLDEDCDLDGL